MTDERKQKAIRDYCSFVPLGSDGVLWRVVVELELDLDRSNRFPKTCRFMKKTDQMPLRPSGVLIRAFHFQGRPINQLPAHGGAWYCKWVPEYEAHPMRAPWKKERPFSLSMKVRRSKRVQVVPERKDCRWPNARRCT